MAIRVEEKRCDYYTHHNNGAGSSIKLRYKGIEMKVNKRCRTWTY